MTEVLMLDHESVTIESRAQVIGPVAVSCVYSGGCTVRPQCLTQCAGEYIPTTVEPVAQIGGDMPVLPEHAAPLATEQL